MKIWLNGSIVEAAKAIDADDRGVTLGDGLFETLAVCDGAPLRFDRHMTRLATGATVLGMPVPVEKASLLQAVHEVCAAADVIEGSARITLLRGPAARGVLPPANPVPTLMVTASSGEVGKTGNVTAIISTRTRRNELSPLSAVKSTNYLDAILAAEEARAAGAEEAILLNTQGNVAEATAANVFCRLGEHLVTPPVADGALPGIMRACVMEAETLIERSLSVDDLRIADEVFLTSSLSIRSVIEIDGRPVGDRNAGAVASRLKDLPRRAE